MMEVWGDRWKKRVKGWKRQRQGPRTRQRYAWNERTTKRKNQLSYSLDRSLPSPPGICWRKPSEIAAQGIQERVRSEIRDNADLTCSWGSGLCKSFDRCKCVTVWNKEKTIGER
jgi:hypothetical protein